MISTSTSITRTQLTRSLAEDRATLQRAGLKTDHIDRLQAGLDRTRGKSVGQILLEARQRSRTDHLVEQVAGWCAMVGGLALMGACPPLAGLGLAAAVAGVGLHLDASGKRVEHLEQFERDLTFEAGVAACKVPRTLAMTD